MNRFVRYFFQGLLLIIPIAATVYIIVAAIGWLDSSLIAVVPNAVRVPGLGLVVVLTGITFIGYLGSTFLFRPIFDLFERLMSHLPFVRLIYTSLKDLISAFVGDKKKFNHPVLVVINKNSELKKLGFITQEELSALHLPGYVAVYLPHSYNFSGDLYIVPKESVSFVDAPSAEVMKFIVSGGVTGLSTQAAQPVDQIANA
ncbi:MAG: DUF502 domain-containing protein [Bacteroidota bacterium]